METSQIESMIHNYTSTLLNFIPSLVGAIVVLIIGLWIIKQLEKGIDQLMDEGVAQLFTLEMNNRKIIGTVGALQYEVIQYRLEHEYGAKCSYENFPVHKACWVKPDDSKNEEFKEFKRIKQKFLAHDKYGQLVFLADSEFTIQMTQSKFPSVKLFFTSEFD